MSESNVVEVKPKASTPSTTPRSGAKENPFDEPSQPSNSAVAGEGGASAADSGEPAPKKGCCSCCDAMTMFRWFYRIFKVIVMCALLLMGAASALLCLSFYESESLDNVAQGFGILAQAGFIVLVLVLVLGEIGPKWFLKYFFLFNFWAGRGLALVWMGVESIGNVETLGSIMSSTNATVAPYDVQIIGRVSGWSLIATGILYVFMSLFCLRVLGGIQKEEKTDGEPDHNADTSVQPSVTNNDNKLPPREIKDSRDSKESWSEVDKDEKYEVASHAAIALGMTLPEMIKLFTGAHGEHNAHAHFEQQEAAKDQQRQRAVKAAATTSPRAEGSGTNDEDAADDEQTLEERYYAAQSTGVVN